MSPYPLQYMWRAWRCWLGMTDVRDELAYTVKERVTPAPFLFDL